MGSRSREKWNERYASSRAFAPFPPDAAADWLRSSASLLPAGDGLPALDLACGDGRNARFVAERGFVVDAVDVSDVAISALSGAAAQRGLAVRPAVRDLELSGVPAGPYAVVVSFNYLQRDLFAGMARALAPGGVLVFETFAAAPVAELGRRMDPRFVLAAGELRGAFPTLVVRRYREGVVGERGLASIVAQRPPDTVPQWS